MGSHDPVILYMMLLAGKEDEDDGRGEVKPVEDPPLLPATPKAPKARWECMGGTRML